MYREKRIALVIPTYNEAKLIKPTLESVPALVDQVYVVDDCSSDNQNEVILHYAETDSRITLLKHTENQGPGAAIITGYLQASKDNHDIVVVVGGDNQMPLHEIQKFLNPLIDGKADYTKGNRFLLSQLDDTLVKMPKIRLVGNWMITMLTKIASGYYKVMDFVDGYTAISKDAIDVIDWSKAWKKYGYPMDFLIRMNAYSLKGHGYPAHRHLSAGRAAIPDQRVSVFSQRDPDDPARIFMALKIQISVSRLSSALLILCLRIFLFAHRWRLRNLSSG